MASSAKAYRVLSCLKIFLIVFTVFFLFTGVLFLATGIYGWVSLKHYFNLSPEVNLSLVPVILCGTGGLVIISGLFGFLSAFKNNKCMINCYCFLIGVVFVAEVAGGITAIIFMNKIEDSFEVGFKTALQEYNPSVQSPIAKAQMQLQCCGATSYTDWVNTTWARNSRQCGSPPENVTTVPVSCCKSPEVDSSTTDTTAVPTNGVCYCGDEADLANVYQAGCLQALFGSSGQTLHYLLAATFGVATTQLAGILLATCIYRKLRQISAARRHY